MSAITRRSLVIVGGTAIAALALALAQSDYRIAVAANSPFQTLDDMINAAKSRCVTNGCATLVNGVALVQAGSPAGARFRLVNTATEAEGMTQTIGGFIDSVITTHAGLLPMLDAGRLRLRLLATTPHAGRTGRMCRP